MLGCSVHRPIRPEKQEHSIDRFIVDEGLGQERAGLVDPFKKYDGLISAPAFSPRAASFGVGKALDGPLRGRVLWRRRALNLE